MRTLASVPYKKKKLGICIDCGCKISRKINIRCRPCSTVSIRKNSKFDNHSDYVRDWQLRKKYGIDLDEFFAYWMVCKGKCWICGKSMIMPTKTRGQSLDIATVDHDHKTGNVRGILCSGCNKGIGLLKDDYTLLLRAAKYLKP